MATRQRKVSKRRTLRRGFKRKTYKKKTYRRKTYRRKAYRRKTMRRRQKMHGGRPGQQEVERINVTIIIPDHDNVVMRANKDTLISQIVDMIYMETGRRDIQIKSINGKEYKTRDMGFVTPLYSYTGGKSNVTIETQKKPPTIFHERIYDVMKSESGLGDQNLLTKGYLELNI